MSDELSIGQVARRAGLRTSAIRYYESVGLVTPARRIAGRRVYDASVFESLAIIRLAQEAGFTVGEIRRLISGFEGSTPASTRWQSMAKRKVREIEKRIDQAQAMKALLERLLRCRCDTLGQCVRRRAARIASN